MSTPFLQLTPLSAAPSTYSTGTICVANRTSWDPAGIGSGPPYVTFYNGTSWTTSPASLSSPGQALGSAGTQTAALGFGGFNNTTQVANTESYTGEVATAVAKTLTTS